jgi:hypothetical protein
MMRKLDQRGVAAFEFCMVAVPLFTLMFAIFELGVYAITAQSLRALANAGARAVMISCYADAAIKKELPTNCTDGSLPSAADRQAAAPFLYGADLTPKYGLTLHVCGPQEVPTNDCPAQGAAALTVTASQPGFSMLMPIWGGALDAPSASTSIPF